MLQLQEQIKIPHSRIGALIGPQGKTKKTLSRKTGTKIQVDGEKGEIAVFGKPQHATRFYIALDIIKAIGRGFSPEHAFLLLQKDHALEVLGISDFVKGTEKELKTKRGRIIGRKGRARTEIEEKTGCKISVQGKTIAIIGKIENVSRAKKAIEMLLHGARHSKAFDFLDKKKPFERFEL